MKDNLAIVEKRLNHIHDDILAIDTEMRQAFSKIEFDDKEERKQKEDEKREVLKFLSSIGFDQIPQSITDNLINQLNLNSSLRSKL